MIWLDGYSGGDNQWSTYGYRDWDQNYDPALMPDLSFQMTWFSVDEDPTQHGDCLSLAPNGLILQQFGAECNQSQDALCEHQSCYTKEGFECLFPFSYKGVVHDQCISEDVYQPWCATGEQ